MLSISTRDTKQLKPDGKKGKIRRRVETALKIKGRINHFNVSTAIKKVTSEGNERQRVHNFYREKKRNDRKEKMTEYRKHEKKSENIK